MQLYEQIKSHFTLPDAYIQWSAYRNTLTNYLIEQTSFCPDNSICTAHSLPTLAVLGAGACNDLDLAMLAPYFSRITLIDSDETAMQTACRTYSVSTYDCVTESFNGITDADYEDFCRSLQYYILQNQSAMTLEDFEQFATHTADSLLQSKRNLSIPLKPDSYDYIWCFGLHSQFMAMFSYIYQAFVVNLKNSLFPHQKQTACFETRLKAENDIFIPKFHDAVLSCARKELFFGFEQNRVGIPSPVEGAFQGIADIKRRNFSLKEHLVRWQFLPDTAYDMYIAHITL